MPTTRVKPCVGLRPVAGNCTPLESLTTISCSLKLVIRSSYLCIPLHILCCFSLLLILGNATQLESQPLLTRESNRLSVGVVKAGSDAGRTNLGLRTRLKKLQEGRFDESLQPQSLPKRKRAVSRRKTHLKQRAHSSQLRDDTGDVALSTINVMDRP